MTFKMKQMSRNQRSIATASAVAVTLLLGGLLSHQEPSVQAAQKAKPAIASVPNGISQTLSNYCIQCHGADKQKGKVRFDQLATLDAASRADLLSRANEAVYFEEMPPSKNPKPTGREREALLAWFTTQLDNSANKNLKDKMRYPHYGNIVDHELLFSGEIKKKGYTPARRWLVSPQIFKERVMDVFELEGRDRDAYKTREFYGVTNPFVLPNDSGVKDYDIGILTGGHLLVMLNNAKWIAGKQVFAAKHQGTNHRNVKHANPKDNWYPRNFGPESFKAILNNDSTPTDEQLAAAIQKQFDLVLNRQASEQELAKYLGLMHEMVGVIDNENALKQLCTAVLLESDFLYRVQFGGGEPDEYGRKMLTPHEAAFAISYALGDRGPDEAILKAAEEGRLQTKDDYKREVDRLLADETYYRGPVDPSLNGKHYQSNETSHPKTIRFFRDFFGYRAAAGVFKDPPRALGKYQNPSRGTVGSPGWLILEADKILTWHVENDKNVFENLLTSDKYFVYDQYSGEKGEKTIAEWRGIWDTLKGTPWKTEPLKVLEENFEFIKAQKTLRITKVDEAHAGSLLNHLHYFSEFFPKSKTPFPRVPWSHGYYYHHSIFYSLPPTPSTGRYGNHRSTKYTGDKIEDKEFWDYPLQQPFSIPNRKGILSHPAWLIAHSQNFHTDPIRRGRWIREKLLAGRVPDVPITVDAQVPEDPHRTFRERVVDVTAAGECRKCHKHMNPLGLPFEAYDDFGRYRTEEVMEHPDNLIKSGNGKTTFDKYPTKPIETTGALDGTGNPKLDGAVEDPFELIEKLAKSNRVRQSIIRHAFRFYLGRNETLADSQTLIDADNAYVESGGSFRAVIVSLLTSDSFMYRKHKQ